MLVEGGRLIDVLTHDCVPLGVASKPINLLLLHNSCSLVLHLLAHGDPVIEN